MRSLFCDGSSSSSMQNNFSNDQSYTKTHGMLRWKSGKRVDPKLLVLLESFGEIYTDRHELFKKIFHGDHEELFKKIGDALNKKKKQLMKMKKSRSMTRSLSMREINQRGIDDEIDEGLRLERFKIRTPNVIVVPSDDTSPTSHGVRLRPHKSSSKGLSLKLSSYAILPLFF